MVDKISKEEFASFIKHRKVELLINEKCQEILNQIGIELNTIFKKGKYSIGININKSDKIIVSLKIDDTTIDPIEFGYDVIYDEASYLIAMRELKDVLYETRKNMSMKPKPPTLWDKIKEWL